MLLERESPSIRKAVSRAALKPLFFRPSADGASAVILGRRKANIEDAAAELSKATGQKCLGFQADVRQLETLEAAVKQTVAELGRIDFVVAGAAGNFLAPIDGASRLCVTFENNLAALI